MTDDGKGSRKAHPSKQKEERTGGSQGAQEEPSVLSQTA